MRRIDPQLSVSPATPGPLPSTPDGDVRCQWCGKDKFGEFRAGVLHVKYRERQASFTGGSVRFTCRSCNLTTVVVASEISEGDDRSQPATSDTDTRKKKKP